MKKIIALLLAVITAVLLSVPSFAEESVIQPDRVDDAVEIAVAALADDKIVSIEGLDWLIDEVMESAGKRVTAKEISDVVSGYIFISEEEAEELSDKIVENSHFFNAKLDDGTYTVYISVKLYKYPELFNYKVFKKTIDKFYDNQFNYMEPDREYTMMTYRHLAGEMALHQILYKMLVAVGADKASGILGTLYNKAHIVDLNVDESRVPPFIINLAGFILTTMFDILGISKIL